jgi:4-aminobutyrate aminotransferase-like enzyme
VITRRDVAERLSEQTSVFSTFGGNPVAARAALAVLDVIEDERLLRNTASVGAALMRSLEALRADHQSVVEVRGRGLLVGVELEDAASAERVVDALRADSILIGRTGKRDNVLKIRPPLVFGEEHADLLVGALERALTRSAH